MHDTRGRGHPAGPTEGHDAPIAAPTMPVTSMPELGPGQGWGGGRGVVAHPSGLQDREGPQSEEGGGGPPYRAHNDTQASHDHVQHMGKTVHAGGGVAGIYFNCVALHTWGGRGNVGGGWAGTGVGAHIKPCFVLSATGHATKGRQASLAHTPPPLPPHLRCPQALQRSGRRGVRRQVPPGASGGGGKACAALHHSHHCDGQAKGPSTTTGGACARCALQTGAPRGRRSRRGRARAAGKEGLAASPLHPSRWRPKQPIPLVSLPGILQNPPTHRARTHCCTRKQCLSFRKYYSDDECTNYKLVHKNAAHAAHTHTHASEHTNQTRMAYNQFQTPPHAQHAHTHTDTHAHNKRQSPNRTCDTHPHATASPGTRTRGSAAPNTRTCYLRRGAGAPAPAPPPDAAPSAGAAATCLVACPSSTDRTRLAKLREHTVSSAWARAGDMFTAKGARHHHTQQGCACVSARGGGAQKQPNKPQTPKHSAAPTGRGEARGQQCGGQDRTG
jgi:hypothetical protein